MLQILISNAAFPRNAVAYLHLPSDAYLQSASSLSVPRHLRRKELGMGVSTRVRDDCPSLCKVISVSFRNNLPPKVWEGSH